VLADVLNLGSYHPYHAKTFRIVGTLLFTFHFNKSYVNKVYSKTADYQLRTSALGKLMSFTVIIFISSAWGKGEVFTGF
jgi:hypothetical protein